MANAGGEDGEAERSGSHPVIVCIGASAGGVQALQRVFEGLAEATGAAFVVVVHLDPDRRSELQNVLSARTRMRVMQIEERAKLEADHVYVIPPDRRPEPASPEICPQPFDA